ncbi:SDR family NAD(P)-dependent oxidoreductase [Novosphingobium sp. AAP93]|uniref:SDR family NAD(P)-dependent oxidoreductase n=1 Tax=Novosphingobium sp. AAP93 TaxID=1523427 RepID=UPI0006B8F13D|nr:SDR family NAD(P)-dependent oxidoreductase [Novosphingobium sp. AAP93]KPF80333.1 hypothetical protein IP83_15115 [Novosphingobium sp. AAP93]
MGELSGKVAIVTGAARGQGRAMALALAGAGADVAICDVGEATMPSVGYPLGGALDAVAREIEALGVRALYAACDIRRQAEIDAFVGRVQAEFGRIDILVNNAGILTGNAPMHLLDDETFETTLAVNLTGGWRMSRAVVPMMISGGAGGRIINIASVAGMIGTPGFGHYCATKHAMIGITKTMAAELGAHGITVNAVCPGFLPTPMVEHTASEIAARAGLTQEQVYEQYLSVAHVKEPIQPEQTAASVLYLASEAARVVTGSSLVIDAGWSAT